MPSYTFHRSERLKSKKTISLLFQKGRSIRKYPLIVRWVCEENSDDRPVQVAFSIPKRLVPKAVHRNKIKRIIKETYRLNKHSLYKAMENNNKQFAMIIIYQGKTTPDFHEIELLMKKMIPEIGRAFNKF